VAPDRHRTGGIPVGAAAVAPADWAQVTTPQMSIGQGGGRHRHRRSAVAATAANLSLEDTSWWPDVNEATFRARQDAGLAALIAVATHAARF